MTVNNLLLGQPNHFDIRHWSCHIEAQTKSFCRLAVQKVGIFVTIINYYCLILLMERRFLVE